MASHLHNMFRDAGKTIIGKYLPKLVGQPSSALADGTRFRQLVTDPAWAELPLPCRLLGRERIKWDEVFDELREAAYDTSGPKIKLKADAVNKTGAIFKRAVGGIEMIIRESQPPAPTVAAETEAATPTAADTSAEAANSKVAIGIDLGTTYSAVAYVDAHGRPESIRNSAGDLLTPSVVLFEDGGTIVGKEAELAAAMEVERIASCVKRDMGSKSYSKKINGEFMPPEVISSIVLRSLKADAERRLGPVSKVVITVPAYFDEPRRQATIDAGKLAGLNVLDIINEPTAAAVAYGYQLGFLDPEKNDDQAEVIRALIYDLGGGTFDVTILEIQGNSFKAVATDGDVRLGGKDWDDKIIDIAAQKFVHEHREDPRTNPSSLQDLVSAAELAKKTLSERQRATLFVSHLGTRMKMEITREEFENATAALVNRTRQTTELVLREADLTWDKIDQVLLVGGSTRMPMIAAMLEEVTGKRVDRSLSPDEAVCHGAALYADLLLQRQSDEPDKDEPKFSLTNVNSHSLGIVGVDPRTKRKVNRVLIPKNTALPHTVQKTFKTADQNQQSVKVQVLEGESPMPDHCTLVGVSVIRDLPPDLPAGWPVTVSYHYEEDGRLQVKAKVKGHDAAARATFSRDHNLPEDDMMAWSEYVAHESRRMTE